MGRKFHDGAEKKVIPLRNDESRIDSALERKLDEIVHVPVLLVATDYDGTLAPIVSEPEKAFPDREALVALQNLAALPQTHVAIISGRALSDLANFTGPKTELHLVGSHGSEFDPGFASSLPAEKLELRARLLKQLKDLGADRDGFRIEEKPASLAFHYRNADPARAEELLQKILEGPARLEGVFLKRGKKFLELALIEMSKGAALNKIRHRLGASAVVFFGDDITDEEAFQSLTGPDVGIKVGEGTSAAHFRVESTIDVSRLLARLSEKRAEWLKGAAALPIQDHSLLSDLRTLALISPQARVVWFCLPRVDSNAIFSELIGGSVAGFFAIESADGTKPMRQYYSHNSMLLVTEFRSFKVVDYLDCSGGRINQRAGRTDLIRLLEGEGKVRVAFAPRLDFGRIHTRLKIVDEGIEIEDTPDPIILRSSGVAWTIHDDGPHQTAHAELTLVKGTPVALELFFGTRNLSRFVSPEAKRREQTDRFWREWADQLSIPDYLEPVRSQIIRSAITLKSLSYGPTGAIVAAATTSLPESIGGVRNWDYRFSWLRDGALTAQALVKLGTTTEAMDFLDWVFNVLDRCSAPDHLCPLYTVLGTDVNSEGEISELPGYAGSRPVRIGNSASRQIQLDVFGPIVDLIWDLCESGAPVSSQHWRVVEAMVLAVQRRWREPDHGIWEVRGHPKHYTHSKVMCWVTLDRAIKIGARVLGKSNPKWEALRSEIAEDILHRSWKPSHSLFASAYETSDVDAAVLKIGLSGLLSGKSEDFIKTVNTIEKELRVGDTVYRYRADDYLPGMEGGFNLCTCWLIQSYAIMGEREKAQSLFNAYLQGAIGKTGLIPEEWDPKTKSGLGNHPQAYSHLGLIESAFAVYGVSLSS